MSEILENQAQERPRERSRPARKPRNSQIPYALLLIAVLVVLGIFVGQKGAKPLLGLLLGLAFGYVLQRSRFCFSAALRDPSLTGSTSLTRAVLLAFALTSIGFTAVKYAAFSQGADIPGSGNVGTIGIPLVAGALLFGIGMVLAGGCASGTLMRLGEGFTLQLIAVVFFSVGQILGAHNVSAFWGKLNEGMPKIFLPDVFGWAGGLAIQMAIIVLLYIAAVKWQKKKTGSEE